MPLRAINVGRPREVLWRGQRVRTAIGNVFLEGEGAAVARPRVSSPST